MPTSCELLRGRVRRRGSQIGLLICWARVRAAGRRTLHMTSIMPGRLQKIVPLAHTLTTAGSSVVSSGTIELYGCTSGSQISETSELANDSPRKPVTLMLP